MTTKGPAQLALAELRTELTKLVDCHGRYALAAEKLIATGGAVGGVSGPRTVANPQHLMLQQTLEKENRLFTMISNIMKTKHDTAKTVIDNLR